MMAELKTRQELEEEIKELEALYRRMLPEHLVCLKCLTLYKKDDSDRLQMCYCDWESDRF